ncbi:MAG: prepilin-type N-terminal cleavage/methylation domain-containing protein [Planctomycetota bacterium]|nr:prepilin-type N-terminal cleavage/methylation domain-containing protein [Planctomycetota bacterium]
MPHAREHTRPGFSLIELLVVVAVLAVLIAILLPALAGAQDSSRRTGCSSNLRSLAQTIEVYKNDYEQRYPLARYIPRPWLSGSSDPGLNDKLAGYVEPDSAAYRCPSDSLVWNAPYRDDQNRDRVCGMSYLYFTAYGGLKFEETPFARFLNLSPTQAPLSHDFDGGTFEKQDGSTVLVDFFHRKRPILFADGHVGDTMP